MAKHFLVKQEEERIARILEYSKDADLIAAAWLTREHEKKENQNAWNIFANLFARVDSNLNKAIELAKKIENIKS
jgi:hypothetical protein